MSDADLVQRSVEWLAARCGSLGASVIGKALDTLKRGDRSRASLDLMHQIAAERIIGQPARWVNPLKWGVDHEAEARLAYAFLTNLRVTEPGLIRHPTIEHAHCSPDALVGDDGGLEIKCPTSAVHLQTMLADAVPEEHLPQMHWGMACSGRGWWDFMSYDPRFPSHLQVFIRRVERDDKVIAEMEEKARVFLAEVEDKIARFSA